MKKIIISISLFLISTSLLAVEINPILPHSSSIKWFDAINLPPGAKLAILAGDPNKKMFYVARLKLPANFTIPIHSHLTDEHNTILSGVYYMGIGDVNKKELTIALPAGSFVTFPAGVKHYGYTKEETIIEISGVGPWGTIPHKLSS